LPPVLSNVIVTGAESAIAIVEKNRAIASDNRQKRGRKMKPPITN